MTRKTSTSERPFAGYIRVSDFDAGAGHSPEWQEKIIRQAAKAKGDRVIFPVKPDLNVSGAVAADERALGKLLQGCADGKYTGIYVWRVSRFGRNAGESLVNVRRLTRDLGCHIVSVEDGADSRSPGWKTTFGFMAVLAEDELDRISAVWDQARKGAIEAGIHVCSTVPFGYSKDARTKRLVMNPEQAPRVVEAAELRARGTSWTALCRYLDEHAPLGEGKRHTCDGKDCNRKHWTRTRVSKMLANPVYLGQARHGAFVNPKAHEPILTEELFLAANRSGTYRPKTGKLSGQALLAGLAKCAACGSKLQVGRQWSSGKGTERATYYCRAHSSMGKCPAPLSIRVDAVDGYVEGRLLEIFEGPGPIAEAVAAQGRIADRVRVREEAQDVLDKLLVNTRLIAALGEDEYTKAVESAKRDLELAKADEAEVRAAAQLIEGLTEGADVLSSWPTLDMASKRRIVAALLDRVVLSKGTSERGFHPSRVQMVWRGNVLVTKTPDGGVRAPADPLDESEAATKVAGR